MIDDLKLTKKYQTNHENWDRTKMFSSDALNKHQT